MEYIESNLKVMQKYKKASIPENVVEHVDTIYKMRKEAGKTCRKADIWIEMAKAVSK